MGLARPRGGGARGGARLRGEQPYESIQKTKHSALLATRTLDWIDSAWAQLQCNHGWAWVGLNARFATGIIFARLVEMRQGRSQHKKPL
eukprot:2537933-Pyramimonas_sp.AAC.1